MPLYEYECTECGHRTELLQRHGDPPLAECPECGAAVRKLFSAPAVQFKGTGWYVTDYGGKSKQSAAGNSAESGDKKDVKPGAPDKPAKTSTAKDTGGGD